MSQPTITLLPRSTRDCRRYRIEGGDVAQVYRLALQPGESPRCDVVNWTYDSAVDAYRDDDTVSPGAWPELFSPDGRTLTDLGRRALDDLRNADPGVVHVAHSACCNCATCAGECLTEDEAYDHPAGCDCEAHAAQRPYRWRPVPEGYEAAR